jgi:hypothetical protein
VYSIFGLELPPGLPERRIPLYTRGSMPDAIKVFSSCADSLCYVRPAANIREYSRNRLKRALPSTEHNICYSADPSVGHVDGTYALVHQGPLGPGLASPSRNLVGRNRQPDKYTHSGHSLVGFGNRVVALDELLSSAHPLPHPPPLHPPLARKHCGASWLAWSR